MGDYFYLNEWAEKIIGWKVHKMTSYLLLMTFWPMVFKHCITDGRSTWTSSGTILKNKHHLVTLHESILVSLCTFQLTLFQKALFVFIVYLREVTVCLYWVWRLEDSLGFVWNSLFIKLDYQILLLLQSSHKVLLSFRAVFTGGSNWRSSDSKSSQNIYVLLTILVDWFGLVIFYGISTHIAF